MASHVEPNVPSQGRHAPRAWFRHALVLFGAWLALLLSALLLEGSAFGSFVFHHAATAFGYLALQLLTGAAALAACVMTLVRGSTLQRVIVAVPTLLLVLYALVAISGPG